VAERNGCFEVLLGQRVGGIRVIDDAVAYQLNAGAPLVKGTPVYVSSAGTVSPANIPTEEQIVGVVMEGQATPGQPVWVGFGGVVTVNVTGPPIAAGNYLFMSATPGLASRAPGFGPPGVFALAVTGKPGPGPGTILAAFKKAESF